MIVFKSAFEPLVSVVMPARNRERCIARAIESVLAQTYRNFELIVVDDGSSDGTADVAARYKDRLTLVRQNKQGAYPARNNGLRRATGELIALADSDDAWFPDKLERQVLLMRRKQLGLVFGDTIQLAEARNGARRIGRSFRASPPRRGRVAGALAWRNFVPTTTVLVRRSCIDEIGGFCTSSAVSADYLAWFRIALKHEFDYVDAPVCYYTFNKESISFDLGRALAARISLFSAELEQLHDERERRLLRRLLFNLSLHLALAAVRGKARTVDGPLRLSACTAWSAAGTLGPPWTAAFAAHQLWLRARRLAG